MVRFPELHWLRRDRLGNLEEVFTIKKNQNKKQNISIKSICFSISTGTEVRL